MRGGAATNLFGASCLEERQGQSGEPGAWTPCPSWPGHAPRSLRPSRTCGFTGVAPRLPEAAEAAQGHTTRKWGSNPGTGTPVFQMQTPVSCVLPPCAWRSFLPEPVLIGIRFVFQMGHNRERRGPVHVTWQRIPLGPPRLSSPREMILAPVPLGPNPWAPQPMLAAIVQLCQPRQCLSPRWGHHTPEGDREQLRHDPGPPLGAKPLQRGAGGGGHLHHPKGSVSPPLFSGHILHPSLKPTASPLAAGVALVSPTFLEPAALAPKERR